MPALVTSEAERVDTRVEVAMPLRVTFWDAENKPLLDMACTYDISAKGARITGLRSVKETGEIIAIERGRNKMFCRVVWVGDPNSDQRGQVGIQNVETDRSMWEAELRDLTAVFDPVPQKKKVKDNNSGLRRSNENRRRDSRFKIEGHAEMSDPASNKAHGTGSLKDISELGCLISIKNAPPLGTDLNLTLKIENYEFNLSGQVRHVDVHEGTGIQFHKIRKGDRQMLQFLLRKLAEQNLEESLQVEVQG